MVQAGGIWGSWKGLRELKQAGVIDSIPRIFAVQPEAVRHAAVAYENGRKTAEPFGNGNDTLVQSLADSVPLFGDERPLSAVYDTGGIAISAADRSTAEAMRSLGRERAFCRTCLCLRLCRPCPGDRKGDSQKR